MSKIKRLISLSIIVCILTVLCGNNVFASSSKEFTASHTQNITETDILSMEGPSVTFKGVLEKDEKGNYSGEIRSGFTTVTCILSGNTAGVPELYTIYITWKGGNAVQAIKADSLDIIGDIPYYSDKFIIQGLSSVAGSRPVGSCLIPESENRVYISTDNLQCFFYNEDFWVRFGEISGWINI